MATSTPPAFKSFARRMAQCLCRTGRVLFLAIFALAAAAAELRIGDGVVVKFGDDAGLVVRGGLSTGRGTVLTSQRDASISGATGPAGQPAARGDWRGVLITPSASPSELLLDALEIRYAGGGGAAALETSGQSLALTGLAIRSSIRGLRLEGPGGLNLSRVLLRENESGAVVTGEAAVTFVEADFVGNFAWGILNRTPATVVQATGSWWGAASGPKDPVGNPSGDGDRVSEGVNYGQYLTAQALYECSVASTQGYATARLSVRLALACRNATDYRLSESPDFAGVAFKPMVAAVDFELSPAAGDKMIYAQYRGPGDGTVTVQLSEPIRYTPHAPTVSFTFPAEGATIAASETVLVEAADPDGVDRVEFWADDTYLGYDSYPPYSAFWNLSGFSNGPHRLKAVAINPSRVASETTRQVIVAKVAPEIFDIQFNGVALQDGNTLHVPGFLSFRVQAAAGAASGDLRIDGQPVAGGQLSGDRYSAFLDFNTVPNGSHTLLLRATDRVGGSVAVERAVILDLAAPPAPVISSPRDGAVVGTPRLTLSGSAQAGARVQLYLDGAPLGAPLSASAQGDFFGVLDLPSTGSHQLGASASNSRGSSPLSAPVQVRYDAAAPVVALLSPAENALVSAPVDISVSVVDALPISRVEFSLNDAPLASFNAPPYVYRWEVNETLNNATHRLVVTAVNSAGLSSAVTRLLRVQLAQPPAAEPVTTYTGEILDVTPATSLGEQPVRVVGRARDRATAQAVPHAALKLVFRVAGFERKFTVATEADGSFAFDFHPQASDEGQYTVGAWHPDEKPGTASAGFRLDRLSFSPSRLDLHAARGFAQPFQLEVRASAGQTGSLVYFLMNPEDQPSGSLLPGVSIDSAASGTIPGGGSAPVQINFSSTEATPPTGTVVLTAYALSSGVVKRGKVTVNFRLSEARPALYPTPTIMETGLKQGERRSETLTLENKGLVPATNVVLQLLNQDGSNNLPPWIYLASSGRLGNLELGKKQTVQIELAPEASVSDGIYNFRLRVTADNAAGGEVPLAVSITQSGVGNLRFRFADIYTNTLDANGNPIPGLAGASVRLQNVLVPTVQFTATSDSTGLARFDSLPAGIYTYRASARDHGDTAGRVTVKPGVTGEQAVFLDYNVVSIEFSVRETTIQDRYEIVLTATYQTQVPAPVVLIEPAVINLPDMQAGEEISGEVSITNYGLLRADNVLFTPPASDENFRYEFFGAVPESLEAKERVTLAYRITALTPLSWVKKGAPPGTPAKRRKEGKSLKACGDSYGKAGGLKYSYACANGDTRGGSAPLGVAASGPSAGCGPSVPWGHDGGPDAGGFYGGGGGGGTSLSGPGCAPSCGSGICIPPGRGPCGPGGGPCPGGGCCGGGGGGPGAPPTPPGGDPSGPVHF